MSPAASIRKPPPFFAPPEAGATLPQAEGSSPPGTARLLVTAGPGKGAELALAQGTATLGRGADNTLVVPDISVSRRHARLEERGADWMVVDEGSGNGTRVNGSPVREQRLRDGDEIAVGDTRIQFLEPGGVAARALPGRSDRARPFHARLVLLATLVMLLLAVGSGVHLWRRLESERRAFAAREQDRALAGQRFQRAVALVESGQREQARQDLEVAAELDPSDPEIRRARATLAEDVAARVEAQPAPKQPPVPAPDLASEAPAPSRPTATTTAARIEAIEAAPHRRAKSQHRADRKRSAADAEAFVAAYRMGDSAAARQRAQKSADPEAQRLGAALKDFERACRQAAAQQTPADAVRSLEEAAAADRAIVGSGESRPGNEVRKALSAQHLLAAASLKSDDQLPQAAAHLRAAVEANASNQAAHDALRRLQDRLHDPTCAATWPRRRSRRKRAGA